MTNLEKVADANNLIKAYKQCRKDSAWKESVQRYGMDLLLNIAHLQDDILNNTYKQKPFFEFTLNERGKTRPIKSLHINDRVFQRSLCDNALTTELLKYLIYDNGASLKNKGVDFARRRLVKHLVSFLKHHKKEEGYVLKIDFSKFFDNIPHEKLINKIKDKLSDKSVIPLIYHIIRKFKIDVSYLSDEEYENCLNNVFDLNEYRKIDKNLLTNEKFMNKSVGIGSQISQISGIFYPTEIDNFCKIVKGCKYYGRYMDDIYIIHHDKKYLKQLLDDIIKKANEIGLFINNKKTKIIKLSKGFTFLQIKYTISDTNKIIRKLNRKAITRERRKLKAKKNLVDKNILTKEKCKSDYNSWHGSFIKYNNWFSIRNLDILSKNLYN